MNDDFLHRIRVDPPARFLAELKAKLDGQGVARPTTRRVSLRTLAILIFLGGTGVAIALMVSRGIPSRDPQLNTVATTASSQPNVLALVPVAIQSPPPESTTNTSMSTAADTPIATSEQKTEEAGTAASPVEIDWVLVPDGGFVMGATEEQKAEFFNFSGPNFRKRLVDSSGPPHEVHLDGFYILRNLVTNHQYEGSIGATAHMYPGEEPQFHGANQPVVNVTWDDARAFCASIGARLPSEAEWEKAARGTQGFVYPWGNTWDPNKLQSMDGIAHQSFANQAEYQSWREKHIDNAPEAKTADVGSFAQGASPYGVLDMAGNAWEWVNDWFDLTYYQNSPKTNPKGPETGEFKVLRGGAWDTPRTVNFTWMRENFMAPNSGRRVTSFRCAKDARKESALVDGVIRKTNLQGPSGAAGGKYENLLLQVLMANAAGECPAALMRDELKKSCELQLPDLKDKLAKLGPFKGISFQTTRPLEGGPAEVYKVTFDHGDWTWILNAESDGKEFLAFSLGQPNWDIGSFGRKTSQP
jgi:formylglycine-generating enzyme